MMQDATISQELIEAVWEAMPSPWEIDVEDKAAAIRLIKAVLNGINSQRSPSFGLIPTQFDALSPNDHR